MAVRTVVTGAAGFIGSHLCEALVARGHDVVGIDCFSDYYDPRIKRDNLASLSGHQRFQLIEGSLCEIDLARALADASVVFHLAAQPGVRASWGDTFEPYIEHNVRATQRLCEAMRALGGARLVYASSSSIYGQTAELPMREEQRAQPRSPYGVTKLAGESLCLLYGANFGLPVVCLRYFTVYGPRQRPDMAFHRFIRAGLEGTPIEVYGAGTQTRGIVRGRLEVRDREEQKGDVTHTQADVSRAQRELGYAPKTSLEDGLVREVEWMESLGGRLGRV
jgi:UDP-glucose 4-epimerase